MEVEDQVIDNEMDIEEVADSDQSENGESESNAESEEVVVTIGEEEHPPEDREAAPAWVKDLRKQNREKEKRIRELEAKLNTAPVEKKITVGPKPKLEDHDYDTEKYESELANWFDRKRQSEVEAQKAKDSEANQQKAWQEKIDSYGKAKAELKVRDFDDAEATVQESFNVTQQGIVLQGAENPALVIYALGKNPKKAQELSKIDDPVRFAFAVAKLEKDLKVTNRKIAPAPERSVTASSRGTGNDSKMEQLRAQAEKTGDFSKVMDYRRQLARAK